MKKSILLYISILFFLILAMPTFAQTTGLLYGMTYGGGPSPFYGVLLSYDPISNLESVPIAFSGPANGARPTGNLVQALNGQLYGMTMGYGGILFSYNVTNNSEQALFSFTGPNGFLPTGSLIQAADSLLYGMASEGGSSNEGVLFSYNIVTGKDSVRFSFAGPNGAYPGGSLLQAKDGKLYGMTQLGGSNDSGVIFRFDPKTGKDTVLVNMNKATGAYPYYGSLVQDTNGLLYGLTAIGGQGDGGVLFSYNPITGKDTVLVNLTVLTGYSPRGSLVHDSSGVLYGMTYSGGSSNTGTLFSYTPVSATFTILFDFISPNGASPNGSPMLASNGLLYGMTLDGGINATGTLFNYNLTTHIETKLLDFTGLNGMNPYADLIEVMGASVTGNDSLSCYGDSNGWAKVNVRGAKMPVTYLWSNSATVDSINGLKAGKYVCTIKDSRGITLSDTITIYQPSKLMLSPSVSNACFGDSNGVARTNASGGIKPYTYRWNNGATTDSISGLKQGKDTCIVTDAKGCSVSVNYTVTQAAPLKIDSIVSTPSTWPSYSNGTVKIYVSGGIPAGDSIYYSYEYRYACTPGGDSTTLRDTLTVYGLPPGGVIINVTNACTSIQDSTTIPMSVVPITSPGNALLIYPIPSKGQLSVYMQGRGFKLIAISDELGREVYRSSLDANRDNYILPLDLSQQPSGIYIVQVIAEKGTSTRKLVIQK